MASAKPLKKLHRLGSDDFSTAEAVLKAAALLIVPDNQTQKQAFDRLMPHLYALKNRGCSIEQITSLLGDLNFKLQPSAVRVYFAEGLAERMDKCQERMNEQILLLAEVRKATIGAEVSSMSERVTAMLEKQRSASAAKIDNLFGGSSATPVAQTFVAVPNEAAKPLLTENKNSGLRPAPPFPPPESKAQIEASPSSDLRCLVLKDGPPPLKKRENVPSEIYLPGDLEHPKIPGLMLSLEARLYGAALEYADKDGEIKIETLDEKRFRVSWKKPVAMTQTRTGDSFTKMDSSSYDKKKAFE